LLELLDCESVTTSVSILDEEFPAVGDHPSIIFWTYYFQHHKCRFSGTVNLNREALPWLKWLVANVLPQRPWLNARPVHVGFVVDKMAQG
jgi:hypothetical protein